MPANLSVEELRDVYARLAPIYRLWERWGEAPRRLALEMAAVRDGERVLELAVGPGLALRQLAAKNVSGATIGVDITGAMLRRTLRLFRRASLPPPRLCQCDGRSLPFEDASFDLVFSSHMLDSLSAADIETAIDEIRRVLKPSGRMLVLHIASGSMWFNRFWRVFYWLVPNLLGGCRPIRLAGYLPEARFFVTDVRRVTAWGIPTEMILARRSR